MDRQTYGSGDSVEKLCAACGEERNHMVAYVSKTGRVIRVNCPKCSTRSAFSGKRLTSGEGARAKSGASYDRVHTDRARQFMLHQTFGVGEVTAVVGARKIDCAVRGPSAPSGPRARLGEAHRRQEGFHSSRRRREDHSIGRDSAARKPRVLRGLAVEMNTDVDNMRESPRVVRREDEVEIPSSAEKCLPLVPGPRFDPDNLGLRGGRGKLYRELRAPDPMKPILHFTRGTREEKRELAPTAGDVAHLCLAE